MSNEQFDYIIVGAGSAGCVIANRLSAKPNTRVLLLEAGGSDRWPQVRVPLGYGLTFYDPKFNWRYQTEPEPALDNRSGYWPRGKVLGGSSSINAMVYKRGLPMDFDGWRDAGNPGWGWEDVELVYQQLEQGELPVTDIRNQVHPLCEAFIEAGESCGYPRNTDFNHGSPEGVGIFHMNTRNGWRGSTASEFLRPALAKHRRNLTLRTGAMVTRITFADDEQSRPRATGIVYRKGQREIEVTARKEVILCGGAINSPQLLQLSGIGNPELLNQFDIPLIAALPGVGQNLQDHLAITHQYRSHRPTLNNELYPLLGKLRAGLKYLFTRQGIMALGVNQGGGFVRSKPELEQPDLQLYFNPLTYTLNPKQRLLVSPDAFAAFSMSFNVCRPGSRGSLAIKSNDPTAAPSIRPNYLSTEEDIETAKRGCHILRKLAAQPALRNIIEEEMLPGSGIQSDGELLDDFRKRAGTIYHACGTCQMGPDATQSVVDAQLRVHGVDNLRVIDASIFPSIPSGNTNGPTIMTAARAAAFF